MKTAYIIRSGEMTNAINVSNKLRNYRGSRRAIKAAKRLGFPLAYAGTITVSNDAKLIG